MEFNIYGRSVPPVGNAGRLSYAVILAALLFANCGPFLGIVRTDRTEFEPAGRPAQETEVIVLTKGRYCSFQFALSFEERANTDARDIDCPSENLLSEPMFLPVSQWESSYGSKSSPEGLAAVGGVLRALQFPEQSYFQSVVADVSGALGLGREDRRSPLGYVYRNRSFANPEQFEQFQAENKKNVLYVRLEYEQDAHWSAYVSALTLTLLPGYYTVNLKMSADYFDERGRSQQLAARNDVSVRCWMHLIFSGWGYILYYASDTPRAAELLTRDIGEQLNPATRR